MNAMRLERFLCPDPHCRTLQRQAKVQVALETRAAVAAHRKGRPLAFPTRSPTEGGEQ